MKLTSAQRFALSAFADGARLTAAQAASVKGVEWPASGNFGQTVRRLMKMGFLEFDSRTAEYFSLTTLPHQEGA